MAGISKIASVWQNTEFEVFTFDYQWTIQNALSVIQSAKLETPPFRPPVAVRAGSTRLKPVWKLTTTTIGPSDSLCSNCKRYCSAKHRVCFSIEVAGGLDSIEKSEFTGIWINAKVSILELVSSKDEAFCYIPSKGGNKGRTVQLKYQQEEVNEQLILFDDLHKKLVDGSLTVYAHVTVYTDISTAGQKCYFIDKLPSTYHPLKQPAFELGLMLNDSRKNGVHTDVTLVSGEKEFKAHKVVLAACSTFFRTRFEQRWEREDNTVTMSDVSFDTLEAMLTFMYTGEVQSTDVEQLALDILPAAEEYEISGLKAQCEKAIAQFLMVENVIDKLILAHEHKLVELKAACIMLILKNPCKVQKGDGWKKLKSNEEHIHLYVEILEQLSERLCSVEDYNGFCDL